MMDWERSLTLNEAQLVHQMYTVAAHSLSSFLKQTEFDHKPHSQMDDKKSDIAANVFSVCRSALASYVSTPSLALKTFNPIATAHSNWDQHNLKMQFVKEAEVISDDEASINTITSPVKLGTKALRPQRKRKHTSEKSDSEESTPKRIKKEPGALSNAKDEDPLTLTGVQVRMN